MIRTGFSFGAAVGHLPEVASRLKEVDWPDGVICDRASTFGFVKWTKACAVAGLRPVYGVELAVAPDIKLKKPSIDHWCFLATRDLRSLNDLVHLATSNAEGGRSEPIVDYREAQAADDSVLIVSGEACQLDLVNLDRVLVGLTPATPVGLYRRAKRMGATFVAHPRNVYPRIDDLELYRVMLGRLKSSTQTYAQHIVSDPELLAQLAWFAKDDAQDAIALRRRLLGECLAVLPRAELLSPVKQRSLRELCLDGATTLGVDLADPVYSQRMERELAMIEEKRFGDYFHIIADLVGWAKQRMVVGPARGSSCGSLVCYLTGITAIDPLRHGLIFERFIDVTRADLPDIDLDFSEEKRDLVFAYAEELYGDRVARLGSISVFAARSALAQVGVALKIPSDLITKVAETVIKRSMGDSRRGNTIEDSLADTDSGRRMVELYPESRIVARLEGHPHNSSRHAAGLVATSSPVANYVAIDARNRTAMCDKYDAEALNLLKIDVLGLTQLSIFERAMRLIGVEPISGWHEQLPTDDPEAFRVLNDAKFCGVFQFEGSALRSLARQIRFESLDDIIAVTALVRPGPLASGGTDDWVKRRTGQEPVTVAHPLIEPYVRETFGVTAYQEQILQIGREVGDLSWADVTALRKAMSKSLGKEYFDQFGDRWKPAAIRKGMPPAVADKFWNDMCQFGAWAFNKAHSVSYAYVSYWCCWWKAHHPIEYACAVLDKQGDTAKQIELLKELKKEGVDYIPVDMAVSEDHWVPLDREDGGRVVLGPLSNVVGVGPKKMMDIIVRRRRKEELPPGLAKLVLDPRTPIDSLTPIGDRIRVLVPDPLAVSLMTRPVSIGDLSGLRGREVTVMATAARIIPKDENEPVKVAKRGYKVHPSRSLILFLRDDSGEILAKVPPRRFPDYGLDVLERGKANKALYAVKGRMERQFEMIWVDKLMYLGDLQ